MNYAKCTVDNLNYSAQEFSLLPSGELEYKRSFLQCPECGGTAFFRHASPIGRAACFGGRPHAQGCQLAAQELADDDPHSFLIPKGRIVVDFIFGAQTLSSPVYIPSHEPMQKRAGCINDLPQAHVFHRRLGSLLQTLIEYPAFSSSDQIIEIDGRGKFAARDIFVPFQYATGLYYGRYAAYFGVVSHAKFSMNNSLWLNSGGNDNISFCLDSSYVDVIFQRYGINDLEELAGAYLIVFGTPAIAQNNKLYCLINGTENMAIKLT